MTKEKRKITVSMREILNGSPVGQVFTNKEVKWLLDELEFSWKKNDSLISDLAQAVKDLNKDFKKGFWGRAAGRLSDKVCSLIQENERLENDLFQVQYKLDKGEIDNGTLNTDEQAP